MARDSDDAQSLVGRDEALAALGRVIDVAPELTGLDRSLAARTASLSAFCAGDKGAVANVVEWSRTALDLDPQLAGRASVAQSLASGHALLRQVDAGLGELDAVCERTQSLGAQCRTDALFGRGMLRLWSHDLDGAQRDFDAGLRAAESASSFVARETARAYQAEIFYRRGRWDEAIVAAHRAVSVIEDSGQHWMAALPHVTLARPLAARGDKSALAHLERAQAAATLTESIVDAGFVAMGAVEIGACARDHDSGIAAGSLLAAAGIAHEQFGSWRASYVDALVAADRLDEAAEIAVDLAAQPSTPIQATDSARAGVVVAAAAGDSSAVDDLAEAGLAVDEAAAGPYARARLELACGAAWRRRGARRRAEEVLQHALRRFILLGAVPWIDRVDREITALGMRPFRGSVEHRDQLTPQEKAVAQLVARGLKNREVAAELMISAKTVEHHLSRTYAKVGVRSRTELTHALLSPANPTS